jgi:uncharacterized protein (TIGR03435 family)
MKGIAVAVSGVLIVALAKAQSEAPLAFEVASVKPRTGSNGFVRSRTSANLRCPPFNCGISGNRFTEEMASLMVLIMDAYSVKKFQISGLPDWAGRDVFDITATVESGRTPTVDQARRMLQTLLADRFQLKLHREPKDVPTYALVVAKNGPKLARIPVEEGKPPAPCPTPSVRPQMGGGDSKDGGGRSGVNRTFSFAGGGRGPSAEELVAMRSWERVPEMLSMFTDRPVLDKTGLEGIYCTVTGEDPLAAVVLQLGLPEGDAWPAIFGLVQEKWGLKLEPQKAPVEILVVDRVERPTAN